MLYDLRQQAILYSKVNKLRVQTEAKFNFEAWIHTVMHYCNMWTWKLKRYCTILDGTPTYNNKIGHAPFWYVRMPIEKNWFVNTWHNICETENACITIEYHCVLYKKAYIDLQFAALIKKEKKNLHKSLSGCTYHQEKADNSVLDSYLIPLCTGL